MGTHLLLHVLIFRIFHYLCNVLTVSIVTYHTSEAELERCLASLDTKEVHAVWIVDNGMETRLQQFAERHGLRYMALDNPGYGAAHNAAIRQALDEGADYHLVLNSDVRFNPQILEKAVAFMDTHPDIGALHPAVTYPDGRPQFTARMLPTPIDLLGRRFLPQRCIQRRNKKYLLQTLDLSRPIDVPYHQGSFMLLRADALKRVGLFDTRFFMYPEDIDLTRRIHEQYITLYWPEINIIHDHRASSYTSWKMTWIHLVNMARYFNKWGWMFDPDRRRYNRRLQKGEAYYARK